MDSATFSVELQEYEHERASECVWPQTTHSLALRACMVAKSGAVQLRNAGRTTAGCLRPSSCPLPKGTRVRSCIDSSPVSNSVDPESAQRGACLHTNHRHRQVQFFHRRTATLPSPVSSRIAPQMTGPGIPACRNACPYFRCAGWTRLGHTVHNAPSPRGPSHTDCQMLVTDHMHPYTFRSQDGIMTDRHKTKAQLIEELAELRASEERWRSLVSGSAQLHRHCRSRWPHRVPQSYAARTRVVGRERQIGLRIHRARIS